MNRVLMVLPALAMACSSGPADPEAPGHRLEISVSPLSLSAVTEAIYRLRVINGDEDLVWTADVSSTRYGDGRGAITYVGPCDASSNDNVVELELLDLRDETSSVPFVNPTASGPLRRTIECEPNRDVAVVFDLTIMRPANQGFFDIAVEFDDIFCSAKVDCTRADGRPNLLLFDPDTGERVPTAVIAAACSAGPDTDTHLYVDALVLDCGAAGAYPLPLAPPLGNAYSENPSGPVMQVATYAGLESLVTGTPPRPASKVYYNTALALDPGAPTTGSCSLIGAFTAHDGPLDGYSTAGLGVYPVIRVAIPNFATSAGLACGLNPLDDPSAPPGTGIFSDYAADGGHTFDLEVRKNTLGELALTLSNAPPPPCDPVPGCAGTITCTVPGAPVCSECEPGRFGPRCTPCPTIEGCEVTVLCSDATDATCADCTDGLFGPQCTPTLGLSSPVARAFVRDTVQLSRTGGAAPFAYEVTAGVAAVDGNGLLVIGDVEGTVTVAVSDASGQSASASVTVVRACAESSPWTTILGEEAGYTNDAVGYNAPIRTELTVDGDGNLYLPASVGEWGQAKTWTLARWTESTGTWTELDRYRRPYSAPSRPVGLFVGQDGRLLVPGSANPNSIDSFGNSTDGAIWSHAPLTALHSFDGSVIELNHFVVETQGSLFLAASGYPSAESNSGAAGLLYTSVDGGATWSLVHRYQYSGATTYYRGALRDSDGGLVLIGVTSSGTNATIVYRKTMDGGSTFSEWTDALSDVTNNHYYLYAALAGPRQVAFAYRSTVYLKDLESGTLTPIDTAGEPARYRYNAFTVAGGIAYAAGYYLTTDQPTPQRWFVRRIDLAARTGGLIDDHIAGAGDNFARANAIEVDVDGRLVVSGQDTSMTRTILRWSSDQGGSWQTIPLPTNGRAQLAVGRSAAARGVVSVEARIYRVDYTDGTVTLVDSPVLQLPSATNAARAIWIDEAADTIYVAGIAGRNANVGGNTYGGALRAGPLAGGSFETVLEDDSNSMGVNFLDVTQTALGRLLVFGFIGDAVGMSFAPFAWSSDDDAETWTTRQEMMDNFERRSSVLVAGPGGKLYYAAASMGGSGCSWVIAESSDEGETWSPIDDFASTGSFCFNERDHQPMDIAFDSLGRIWVVGIGNRDFRPEWVVRRRNLDETWTTVERIESGGGQAGALTIAIDGRDNVYVGGYDGMIRTSSDGGDTWRELRTGNTFIGLATNARGDLFAAEHNGGSQGGSLQVHRLLCQP